jgi:hypothetical protein
MLAQVEDGAPDIPNARRRMTLLFAEEPPIMQAANTSAHNQAGDCLFGDEYDRISVSFFPQITRHFIPWRSRRFLVIPRGRPARTL